MEIEQRIKNLQKYCQDDDLFEKDGDFKEFCDNHIADIKAVIQEIKTTQADLYEANNRINDLLDMMKIKEKIIDYMIEEYEYNARINLKNFCEDEMRKNKCIQDCRICVRKYFEERCK